MKSLNGRLKTQGLKKVAIKVAALEIIAQAGNVTKTAAMSRRRSGNGTSARQWLYVFWNIPFIWIVKVGIAGSVKKRHSQVDRSAPGWDIPIWYIKIPFAYQLEQFIHSMMSFCRIGFWGSGHTERFFIIAAIPAIILSLVLFIIEYAFYLFIALLIAYLSAGAPTHL